MRILFFLLVTSYASPLNAQNYAPTHYLGSLVNHQYYSLSYVEEYEQPEWTFHMICKNCYGNSERKNNFREDPLVKSKSAQLTDYKGSGYDRGHLVPAADMNINNTAMSESFYLSNMSPQKPSFNRGVWRKLETQIRGWSAVYDTLYVVTGPILEYGYKTTGPNEVAIPQFYYKAIYTENPSKMIGFILPNEGSKENILKYQVTIDEIEKRTKLDLFPALNDTLEERLESSRSKF
jgi:endonuclease G